MGPYSWVQYSAVQCSVRQYSAVQYRTVRKEPPGPMIIKKVVKLSKERFLP